MKDLLKMAVMALVAGAGAALAWTSYSAPPRSASPSGVVSSMPAGSGAAHVPPPAAPASPVSRPDPSAATVPRDRAQTGAPTPPPAGAASAPSTAASAPSTAASAPSTAAPPDPATPAPPSPPALAPSAPAPAGPGRPAVGPLLSQTWYGRSAYQLYPGPPSADAERALTGYHLTIRLASATTVEMTLYNIQYDSTDRTIYDSSYRLYFVDTEGDDDAANRETDDSDDIFILTDATGHILASSGHLGPPDASQR